MLLFVAPGVVVVAVVGVGDAADTVGVAECWVGVECVLVAVAAAVVPSAGASDAAAVVVCSVVDWLDLSVG